MGKYLLGCGALLIIAVIVLAIAIGSFWMSTYNGFVGQKNNVDAKWAEVQNQYQRRADLVPNLVATVSGAANFEKSTLIAVTDARASVGQVKIDPDHAPTNQADLDKYQAAQNSLGGAISRLLVVSENYPNLKSNQNFLDLQSQLEGTENRITTARNYFNQAAQGYNTAIALFPANFVANFSGFTARPYFQAVAGSDTPPKVNFDFNSTTAPAPSH
jgi:LemA protein